MQSILQTSITVTISQECARRFTVSETENVTYNPNEHERKHTYYSGVSGINLLWRQHFSKFFGHVVTHRKFENHPRNYEQSIDPQMKL